LKGRRVAVLGAGGSARAVAFALSSAGADISVHARDEERARRLAELVTAGVGAWPPPAGSWDVLVNCTPVGTYPNVNDSPIPASSLTGELVYDLVYNPERTQLLRDASARGCRTIGGLDMLIAQAGEQFFWWTGIEPPLDVMRDAARRRLLEFRTDENHVA
jgi:3-dehydroquinate dehydratase/shikimate dehydrogenase